MSAVELKITVVGDTSVGKTQLLRSYLEHYFTKDNAGDGDQPEHDSEHYYIKHTTVNGIKYKLHLWDTSSRLEQRMVTTLIYPKTDCFILCYAVSNAQTFATISKKWIPDIQRYCPNPRMIVVGTKLDLKNCYGATNIPDKTLASLIIRYKLDAVVECSSSTLEGINQVFKEAIYASLKHRDGLCLIQ